MDLKDNEESNRDDKYLRQLGVGTRQQGATESLLRADRRWKGRSRKHGRHQIDACDPRLHLFWVPARKFWFGHAVDLGALVGIVHDVKRRLTAPGRGTPSSPPSSGRRRWASCCSRQLSWPMSDGQKRRSSRPPQSAHAPHGTHPDIQSQSSNAEDPRSAWDA